MSDYTITTDFSAKDALPTSDPEKLVLGSDLDVEFDAIQVATATKYDSSDIATLAQAQAGTSNETLMTPLRVAQLLSGGGVGDVGSIGLSDPGADRIAFWDDSANDVAWLTVSTGLTLSGTTLTTDDSAILHDSLSGYDSNDHIDHTTVTLTFTEGVQWSSGGTDISASATGKLDFSGLTQETTLDGTNDMVAFYDASATAHRKVPLDSLIGDALGDGNWYRNATQSISSTDSTVVFNTERYDSLTRGTYSTSTGVYTAGSAACRILIHAHAVIDGQAAGEDSAMKIRHNGTTTRGTRLKTNRGKYGASSSSIEIMMVLSLAATDTVEIRMNNDGTKNIQATNTWLDIVELG
ncbi:hypothetical protein CMI47_04475 [Candidatus Pacearchaeota archaeon]|jgi:hypothetical protein|nr:hypothetical protein [Candidatus Pacearchaeota archaeon]|tara:strand:+ start:9722 stop:10777 length:1056 start_codon:yes stop_codon:yes gene_type:complete